MLTCIIGFTNYKIAINAITRSEDKLKRNFVGYSLLFLLLVFLLVSSNHVVVTYILFVLLVLLLFEYFISEKLLAPKDYSKAFLFYSFPLQLILTLIVLIILLQLSLNYDLSYDGLAALVKKWNRSWTNLKLDYVEHVYTFVFGAMVSTGLWWHHAHVFDLCVPDKHLARVLFYNSIMVPIMIII